MSDSPPLEAGAAEAAAAIARLQVQLQSARGGGRAQTARALLERALHSGAGPLGAALPDLLALAADRVPDVRRALAAAIQELCVVSPALVPQSLPALCLLVQDAAPAVQKRAIQAASIAYRVAASASPPANSDQLSALKLLVLNLIDSENEGVRTHSIKFLEEVVVVQSGAGQSDPALLEEAEHIFELLLKFQSSGHVSSVNMMACMTSLVNIARARAAWAGRVWAALQAGLASLPAALSQGQATSVRKHARALAAQLRGAGLPDKRRRDTKPERADKRPRLAPAAPAAPVPAAPAAPAPPPAPVGEEALAASLADVPRVVTLVLRALRRLPAAMPPDFAAQYRPQPAVPLPLQRVRLARLLLAAAEHSEPADAADLEAAPDDSEMDAALPALPATVPPVDAGPPVPAPQEEDREASEFAEKENKSPVVPFLRDEDEKAALKSAVAKLQEAGRVEEAEATSDAAAAATAAAALQERVRLLRLERVTRPLEAGERARLVEAAAARVAGAAVADGAAAAARGKLAALLGAAHGGAARAAVRRALLGAPVGAAGAGGAAGARLPDLLAWLYHEYAYVAGFARLPATLSARPEPPQRHYQELLEEAAERLAAQGDDAALRRLLLEAPRVGGAAAESAPLAVLEELAARGGARAARALAERAAGVVGEDGGEAGEGEEEAGGAAMAAAARVWAAGGGAVRAALRRAAERALEAGRWGLAAALAPQCAALLVALARRLPALEAEGRRSLLRRLEPALLAAAEEGPSSPLLAALLDDCPVGAESLLARLLHLISEKGSLPTSLVAEVRAVYARSGDVRLLLPILSQLHRTEVIAALPALVRRGGAGLLRLVTPPAVLSPGELVEELHLIEVGQAELKQLIKATALCFSEPEYFPPNEVVEALVRLAARAAAGADIPVLLARSLLQALALEGGAGGGAGGVGGAAGGAAPPAGRYGGVTRALSALAAARAWSRRVPWEGWVKCAQRLAAAGHPALPALLRQVPPDHLPDDLRALKPNDDWQEPPADDLLTK